MRAASDLAGSSAYELELLHAAGAIGAFDPDLLEEAGFDDARRVLESLRARGALAPMEELARSVRLLPRRARHETYAKVARALENAGDVERALDAYAGAGKRADVERLLVERGFDSIDRARVDAVLRAIMALDERTRRESAGILALHGVAHAAKGRPVRAEALLRRAIATAADDCRLAAIATIRLAILLVNRREEVREHLEPIACDERQPAEIRAEAYSLLAAQRAMAGEAEEASAATSRVIELLPRIENDIVRAKVLQRVGVAAVNSGDVDLARRSLEEAADLAMELELFSLASRAYATLSNLMRHHFDDVLDQARFANHAVQASERSGDPFDQETALLALLSVETRCSNIAEALSAEAKLLGIQCSDRRNEHISLLNAIRAVEKGRIGEAQHLLARCRHRFAYHVDRVVYSALFALLASLQDRADSLHLISESTSAVGKTAPSGLFERRHYGVALVYCAVAETIRGRVARADSIINKISDDDHVTKSLVKLGKSFVDARRVHHFAEDAEFCGAIGLLEASGYAEVVVILQAAMSELKRRFDSGGSALTPAEVLILRLLDDGLSTKQIAAKTGRSIFTVRAHIANAIAKLGCHGRSEAVVAARRKGLIPSHI